MREQLLAVIIHERGTVSENVMRKMIKVGAARDDAKISASILVWRRLTTRRSPTCEIWPSAMKCHLKAMYCELFLKRFSLEKAAAVSHSSQMMVSFFENPFRRNGLVKAHFDAEFAKKEAFLSSRGQSNCALSIVDLQAMWLGVIRHFHH